jgi:hypothetical protein
VGEGANDPLIPGKNQSRFTPSKRAAFQAAAFESFAGTAGARVIAAEFFFKQFVAVDDADAALDLRLGGKSSPPFAHWRENMGRSSLWLYRMACLPLQSDCLGEH